MIDSPIRRSDRARRARINVSAEGVGVVVPRRMALRQVVPFVEEKRPWIERTLRRIREAEEAAAVRLVDGGSVPYLDRVLTLSVRVEPGRVRSFVSMRGDLLEVFVGSPGVEAVRAAIEAWYRRRRWGCSRGRARAAVFAAAARRVGRSGVVRTRA